MTALTVRLPNSVHARIRELAARDEISVNQFIASAAAEKLASMLTLEFLRQEAAQGRRQDFAHYLRAVPDVPDAAETSPPGVK
jgi:predicted transcriptional regulator